MNPILARCTRINPSMLSADSTLEYIHEGNYIFFQTITRKQGQIPLRLFAVDIDQQKLVLDMPATEAASPHRKILIDEIEGFYTRHEVQGDSYRDYLYAAMQNKEDLAVSSRHSPSTRDLEEMAMVLAAICNKPIWRHLKNGEIMPLETSELLA